MVIKRYLLSLLVLMIIGCTHVEKSIKAVKSTEPFPFYSINIQTINVLDTVYPWLPTYALDGNYIILLNMLDSNLWISDSKGSDVKSITFNMKLPEKFDAGFSYVFPDMKRVFISKKELTTNTILGGDSDDKTTFDGYIMECSNTITNCTSANSFL